MFRPLVLPREVPRRVNATGNASEATPLESFHQTWQKLKTSDSMQKAYDTAPATWKEGGVLFG